MASHLDALPGPACTVCGAPEGARITRLLSDPIRWSLDVDLAFEFPHCWRHATKVVLHQNGVCAYCDHPFRGSAFRVSTKDSYRTLEVRRAAHHP